jgi:hypothetical protein
MRNIKMNQRIKQKDKGIKKNKRIKKRDINNKPYIYLFIFFLISILSILYYFFYFSIDLYIVLLCLFFSGLAFFDDFILNLGFNFTLVILVSTIFDLIDRDVPNL